MENLPKEISLQISVLEIKRQISEIVKELQHDYLDNVSLVHASYEAYVTNREHTRLLILVGSVMNFTGSVEALVEDLETIRKDAGTILNKTDRVCLHCFIAKANMIKHNVRNLLHDL